MMLKIDLTAFKYTWSIFTYAWWNFLRIAFWNIWTIWQCCELHHLGPTPASDSVPGVRLPRPCGTEGHLPWRRGGCMYTNRKLWKHTGSFLCTGKLTGTSGSKICCPLVKSFVFMHPIPIGEFRFRFWIFFFKNWLCVNIFDFFLTGNGNSFQATCLCIQCQQHSHRIHQLWSVRHQIQTDPEDPISGHWYPESLQPGALHLPQVGPRLSACTQMLQGAGGESVLWSFWTGL